MSFTSISQASVSRPDSWRMMLFRAALMPLFAAKSWCCSSPAWHPCRHVVITPSRASISMWKMPSLHAHQSQSKRADERSSAIACSRAGRTHVEASGMLRAIVSVISPAYEGTPQEPQMSQHGLQSSCFLRLPEQLEQGGAFQRQHWPLPSVVPLRTLLAL